MTTNPLKLLAILSLLPIYVGPGQAYADSGINKPPRSAFDFFEKRLNPHTTRNIFSPGAHRVVDLNQHEAEVEPQEPTPTVVDPSKIAQKSEKDYLDRVDTQAPDQFKNLVIAHRQGNIQEAQRHADEYVSYLQNLMFEVKDITKLIGMALIRQGAIEEDAWIGVEQYLEWEMAQAREATGSPIQPTHDKAMERIVSDPKQEAEIYYFFTLSCTYCRYMAADVERLWQVAKNDPKLKMVALTIGPQHKAWVSSYRDFTGLSAPIFEGTEFAKAFNIGFVPALVVVAPNPQDGSKKGTAYIKSGEQSFLRMYEFVRTVQGLPASETPEIKALINRPIGHIELMQASSPAGTLIGDPRQTSSAVHAVSGRRNEGSLSRF